MTAKQKREAAATVATAQARAAEAKTAVSAAKQAVEAGEQAIAAGEGFAAVEKADMAADEAIAAARNAVAAADAQMVMVGSSFSMKLGCGTSSFGLDLEPAGATAGLDATMKGMEDHKKPGNKAQGDEPITAFI